MRVPPLPEACGASAPASTPRQAGKQVARGYKNPRWPDQTQISIRVEDELFEDIRARASRDNVSLSEELRMLLEWGLHIAEATDA